MGQDKIVVPGIEPSPLSSEEELIYFPLGQQQGLLLTRQGMSNKMFTEITKLKILYDMWIYHRKCSICDTIFSYVFALGSLMRIEQRINLGKVLWWEFILGFQTEWNLIALLS
jgi:hypothetical protein